LGYGIVNLWDWPKVKGLHDFKGPYMHSAAYDQSFDPTDKTIALVGGGSSGIQILPEIRKVAKKVDHYMKTANWCAPIGFGGDELIKRGRIAEGNCMCFIQFQQVLTLIKLAIVDYPDEEKELFRKDPAALHAHRMAVEEGLSRFMSTESLTFGTEVQKEMHRIFDKHMKEKLKGRPDILKVMLPDFPPACRRLTPGPGYLEALCEENVEFISDRISHVTKDSIVMESGKERKIDAIIWATGFNM
jgi:cation diffusion facilitator CzcD-associated flavoprotein CzcO